MKFSLGPNWMPTVAGLISAATSLVMFLQQGGYYQFPMWAIGVAMFANVGGLAGLGIVSKQFNVSGGTVGQPSTPEALQKANQAPSATNPPVPKAP